VPNDAKRKTAGLGDNAESIDLSASLAGEALASISLVAASKMKAVACKLGS